MVRIDARRVPEPDARQLAKLTRGQLAVWLALCLGALERQETALMNLYAGLADYGYLDSNLGGLIQDARADLDEALCGLESDSYGPVEGGVL